MNLATLQLTKLKSGLIKSHEISEGQLLFTTDSNELYIDITDSDRKKITDIYILDKDDSRTSTLTPITGFYYVLETHCLWYYTGTEWQQITADVEEYDDTELRGMITTLESEVIKTIKLNGDPLKMQENEVDIVLDYTKINFTTEVERMDMLDGDVGFYYTTDEYQLWYFDGENWHATSISANAIKPTYNDESEIKDLESGETLSNALAKIKFAIKSLKEHITSTNNPHKLNKNSVGLGNVANKSPEELFADMTAQDVINALGYDPGGGNAKIATSRTPGLVKSGTDIYVDGEGNVTVIGGKADELKLTEPIDISVSGKVNGSASFDGSQSVDIVTTVALDGSDIAELAPAFEEAEEKENITSGDTVSSIFGKISKWFTSLKPIAFSAQYSDLTDTPESLKNPNALHLTGAVDETYDGSEEKTVEIPEYTHPESTVEPGTYNSVTVDKEGHVTEGTNPTTLDGYGITDAAVKPKIMERVLDKDSWEGNQFPYLYRIDIEGLTEDQDVYITNALKLSQDEINGFSESIITGYEQIAGQITLQAVNKPTINLPIVIELGSEPTKIE